MTKLYKISNIIFKIKIYHRIFNIKIVVIFSKFVFLLILINSNYL